MAQSTPRTDGPPTNGPGSRRFVDEDDVKHPSEVADPTTLEDDSSRDWKGWVKKHWPKLFIGLPIAFAAFVLAFSQILRVVPELLASRRVRLVGGAGLIAVTCLLFGVKHDRGVIKNLEELMLDKDDNEPEVYYGEFVPGTKTVPDRFIPMKSTGFLGLKQRPYTVEELSAALADRWEANNPDHSRDDPARIWLHRAFTGIERTDLGTKVVQTTGGLEVDEYGETAVLRATPPEQGSAEQINEYEEIVASAHSEVSHLRQKNQRFIRQMKDLREMDNVAVEDALDDFIENFERVQQASYPYGQPRSHSDDAADDLWTDDDTQYAYAESND